MKPVRKIVLFAVATAAVAGIGYWWHARQAAGQPPAAAAPQPNALVTTRLVRRQPFPVTLETFGEVAPGLPESLGFPQAGQLVDLPVQAGQRVRRGDVLARLASDPNATSAYDQATNAVGLARRELARQEALFGLQLATRSQVDAARKQLEDASTALAAQERLGGGRASATLRAPFDGVVSTLAATAGERIAAGATVLQLGRDDRMRVLLALEPARGGQVRPGMTVTLRPPAAGAGPVRAAIDSVAGMIDPKTRMLAAIAGLPGGAGRDLPAGTRVQASVLLARRDAWDVPRQAVLSDEGGSWLFQVRTGRAHRVAVTTVAESGQSYGVEGAVDGAAPVVVLGSYELVDGMPVREETR